MYALAATLYHILAGEPPDVSTFRLVDVAQGKPDPLRPVNELKTQLPQAVAEVLQKAMAVYREERYRSAAEFHRAWREAWEEKRKLLWFEFEVVTVDAKGNIKERHIGRNRYITEDLGGGVLLHLAEITGGEFLMGTPASDVEKVEAWLMKWGDLDEPTANKWIAPELPQHRVKLSPFFIGIYPVTQEQWRAIARLPKVKIDLPSDPSQFKGDKRPVEQVSWEEAVEFCERLSHKTGNYYRLPSEAQWEYACRAGTTTSFHFGETMTPELVNYDGNYPYDAAAVGEFRQETTEVRTFGVANEFGLCDMHGNVWEWCEDIFHDCYIGAPINGSAWLTPRNDNEDLRLLRGGS